MIRTSLPGFRFPVILSATQPVERKRYRGDVRDHVSVGMVSILPIRAMRLYHAARNNSRDAENRQGREP